MAKKYEGNTAVAEPPQATSKRYRVKLHATTYLLHPEALVDAQSESEAWEKFCAMNSISGSSCDREIHEVKE